jgi:hypothetical protein
VVPVEDLRPDTLEPGEVRLVRERRRAENGVALGTLHEPRGLRIVAQVAGVIPVRV